MDVVWKMRGLGGSRTGPASLTSASEWPSSRETDTAEACLLGGSFSLFSRPGPGVGLRVGIGSKGLGNAETLTSGGVEIVYERLWRRCAEGGLDARLHILSVHLNAITNSERLTKARWCSHPRRKDRRVHTCSPCRQAAMVSRAWLRVARVRSPLQSSTDQEERSNMVMASSASWW